MSTPQPGSDRRGATRTPPAVLSNRRTRWEDRTEILLLVAALAFLGAYAWPILDTDLDPDMVTALNLAALGIWALFLVDFLVRLVLAEYRALFIRRNWPDLVILALPMLRPLRGLQILIGLNALARRGGGFRRGQVVTSMGIAVTAVGFIAALAMLDAERGDPDANITSFGDAAWWAAATATTVGYGDRYPVTTEGRFVALGLMITGIALLGVVTAALASWFVEKMATIREAEERTGEEVADLASEVLQLRLELARLRVDPKVPAILDRDAPDRDSPDPGGSAGCPPHR